MVRYIYMIKKMENIKNDVGGKRYHTNCSALAPHFYPHIGAGGLAADKVYATGNDITLCRFLFFSTVCRKVPVGRYPPSSHAVKLSSHAKQVYFEACLDEINT